MGPDDIAMMGKDDPDDWLRVMYDDEVEDSAGAGVFSSVIH